jgi:hypothetical protein
VKNTIFLPKTIKVGFQSRSDTYTKQLAYIIYYDQKNVLRKQASWESWRDTKIEPLEFSNEPTSGFVLNKKVGGYSTGWNHRQTYVRVYDPRNFEFEITVPNLLYILENTNSIKGKGLDGEFVYGWDGTDLLLIPTSSPDYAEISGFSEMVSKPEVIKGKDLVLGGLYRTNLNKDWTYLGRFEKYNTSYHEDKHGKSEGLQYFFYSKDSGFQAMKSLGGRIVKTVSTECALDYAEIMEKLEHQQIYSPLDESKNEYTLYTFEELTKSEHYYNEVYSFYDGKIHCFRLVRQYGGNYYFDNYWASKYEPLLVEGVSKYNGYFDEEKLKILHNKYQFKKLQKYLKNGKSIQ